MLELVNRRIGQLHKSLEKLIDDDISIINKSFISNSKYIGIDFNIQDPDLYNIAESIVNNIATLKDLLNQWYKLNKERQRADDIIQGNRDVAIIHDLWNIQKHVILKTPPRCGFTPSIKNLNRAMEISTSNSSATIEITSNESKLLSDNRSSILFVIDGDIWNVDRNCKHSTFSTTCEIASQIWEDKFRSEGIFKL